MKPLLAIFKQLFLTSRFLRYAFPLWLVALTALTAAYWPNCTRPRESLAGVNARNFAFMLAGWGMAPWGGHLRNLDGLSPAIMQLVPGMRRHMAKATLILWLALSLLLPLPLSVFGMRFPLLVAATMVTLALIVATAKYRWVFAVFAGTVFLGAAFWQYVWPATFADLPLGKAWALALVACAAGATLIVLRFRGAAERRARPYAQMKERYRDARERRNESVWGALLQRPKVYRLVFERVLRLRAPDARAWHGLGPSFHPSEALFGGAVHAALFGLIAYVFIKLAFSPLLGDTVRYSQALLPFVFYIAFFFVIQLREIRLRELYLRRKEEALILLLPGAPSGRALNRWLMRHLLTQHVTAIACALGIVIAMMLVLDPNKEMTRHMGVTSFGASLLATPGLLRDYARMKARGFAHSIWAMIIFAAPLQFVLAFKPFDISPAALLVATLAISAVVTLERYRRFSDAAPAFPVGRLAE